MKKQTVDIIKVDAFTKTVFSGNPAAVCVMKEWLPDHIMQSIAEENNLSETAFIVTENDGYHIRWFTPTVEVDLCGHATIAAAHVFYQHLHFPLNRITFQSKSGPLKVYREGTNLYKLDFPADKPKRIRRNQDLDKILGIKSVETYQGKRDIMCIVDTQKEVQTCTPNFRKLRKMDVRGVIVSAKGTRVDFVSRFFAPGSGVNEDPVTGSAHTTLTPYWSEVTGKKRMVATQLSSRGGELMCENKGDRVLISGHAVTYAKGMIFLDQINPL